MNTFWEVSTFFGVFITLFFYSIGTFLKQKVKHPLVNPMLLAIIFTILFLHIFGINYQTYNNSAKYISYLMTPATICLAVPLYRQLDTLKKNFKAVMFGISSSVIVTMVSVPITVASIVISGILGNMFAESVCKMFGIYEPVAKGVAIGCSSHAMGTVKALEMGEVEGAMSSLSIALAGILTVVAASVFATLL